MTYDSHGNIKTLRRTNGAGATIANYTYSYKANSNQLTAVSTYATYTYDALGQLNSETKGSMSKYLEYDVSGKVTKIYSDAAKTKLVLSFVYDESGARIKKQDHLQNVITWYVGDNIYSGSKLIEQSIPSGIYYRSANTYHYQLTDHVGSVRAIIARNKLASGAVDVIYSTDYYPFGTTLSAAGVPSRYGYQGEYSEKDSESGWNNFYLRNYDPAIGRWLSVDPYGQYYSPYVGMGNDPINRFDPDGGKDGGGGGIWGWFKSLLYPSGHVNNPIKIDEVTVTAFKPNNGTIKAFTPNLIQRWHDNNNIFAKFSYNIIDAPYVFFTGFGDLNNARHLSGYGADPNEFREAGVMTVMMAMGPVSRSAKALQSVSLVDDAAKGVAAPKGWITQASKKGGGTVFKDPSNPHNIIRQMPGNPNSPNVFQQNPYVKFMKDGKFYDVNGKVLPNGNVPGAHIPLNQFNINNMPKF